MSEAEGQKGRRAKALYKGHVFISQRESQDEKNLERKQHRGEKAEKTESDNRKVAVSLIKVDI